MEIRLSGNPDYNPIMQADPFVSSNAPSLGSSGELGPPARFCFLREGGASVRGHRPWRRNLVIDMLYACFRTLNTLWLHIIDSSRQTPTGALYLCYYTWHVSTTIQFDMAANWPNVFPVRRHLSIPSFHSRGLEKWLLFRSCTALYLIENLAQLIWLHTYWRLCVLRLVLS